MPSAGWATPNSPIQAAVLKLIDDPDWAVREQLAASLGALPPGPKETALASLLQRHGDDPVAMDAALSGVRGSEPAVLEKLLQPDAPQTAAREAAIIDGERDDRPRRPGCGRADHAGGGRRRESAGVAARGGAARRGGRAGAEHADAGQRAARRGAVDYGDSRGTPRARHVRPARAGAPARAAPTRSTTRAVRPAPGARGRGDAQAARVAEAAAAAADRGSV